MRVCNVDAPNKWRIDETKKKKKKKRTRRKSFSCSYAHTHGTVDCIYAVILFLSSICLQSLSIVPLLLFLSLSLCLSRILLFISALNDRREREREKRHRYPDNTRRCLWRNRFAELFVCVSRWVSLERKIDRGRGKLCNSLIDDRAYPVIIDAYVLFSCVISSTMIISILDKRLLFLRRRRARCRTQTHAHFSLSLSLSLRVYFTYPLSSFWFFFLLDTSFLFRPFSAHYVPRFHFQSMMGHLLSLSLCKWSTRKTGPLIHCQGLVQVASVRFHISIHVAGAHFFCSCVPKRTDVRGGENRLSLINQERKTCFSE